MKEKQETRMTVRFPKALIEQLKQYLEQDDRSLNAEIVQAVREFVARKRQRAKSDEHSQGL
jgi:metal-responsive CopG/Arc/MetJ family transcriptional regulator